MVLRSRIFSNITIHQMYLYIFVYVVTFSVTEAKDLTYLPCTKDCSNESWKEKIIFMKSRNL